MTWKAYAAVSGATVLAGWLASSPPANAPSDTTPPVRSPGPAGASATDIQEQAERLRTRLRGERDYTAPQRNPFRFDEGGDVYPATPERGTTFEPESEPEAVAPAPAPPPMSLSGIAADQVNGQISRTAIVSSPGGVELLREGDEFLGYRVVRIESEAVELIRIADGTTRRLALTR